MERVIREPNAANDSILETLAKDNNLRPLRQLMGDGADYWVKSTDDPFTIKFPAKMVNSRGSDHTLTFRLLGYVSRRHIR